MTRFIVTSILILLVLLTTSCSPGSRQQSATKTPGIPLTETPAPPEPQFPTAQAEPSPSQAQSLVALDPSPTQGVATAAAPQVLPPSMTQTLSSKARVVKVYGTPT